MPSPWVRVARNRQLAFRARLARGRPLTDEELSGKRMSIGSGAASSSDSTGRDSQSQATDFEYICQCGRNWRFSVDPAEARTSVECGCARSIVIDKGIVYSIGLA